MPRIYNSNDRDTFKEYFGFNPKGTTSQEENDKIAEAFKAKIGEIGKHLSPSPDAPLTRRAILHLREVYRFKEMVELLLTFYPNKSSALHNFQLPEAWRQVRPDIPGDPQPPHEQEGGSPPQLSLVQSVA